jgi:hypothetical protein
MANKNIKKNFNENLNGLIFGTAVALLFLFWGLFIFFTVGDKGLPSWDFGVVEDIPGQSAYSTAPHVLQTEKMLINDNE